ncbi:MAG: Rrf2 family transcriptional regulator [Phycisphaeraceae bacterium]|nr:MAG: Rrf2 family transcriptional regulator [Phycisphaeraceae bacterium]
MISQTIEYALRAMAHLASLDADRSANSETIAEHTRVPRGYLSKILRDLVVAGLIDSQRGPNGGFVLSRDAGKISILDVINAVDPIARITQCPLGNPEHIHLCPLHKRLDDALETIERQFKDTSLEDLQKSTRRASICHELGRPSQRKKDR